MSKDKGENEMKNTDELLMIINDLFIKGEKDKADEIYFNEYLPLIKKENKKMKKQINQF